MAIRQSFVVLTAFFLLTSTVDSIFNGFDGTPEQFPHNVLFKIYTPLHFGPGFADHVINWASGSLISNEWVTEMTPNSEKKDSEKLSEKFLQFFLLRFN